MTTPTHPTSIIIFGASGDLTWRKLIPALYNNYKKGRLGDCSAIIGFARRPYDDNSIRDHLRDGVIHNSPDSFNEETWAKFAPLLHYFKGDLDVREDFKRLEAYLKNQDGDNPHNRLYYLATAPIHYPIVVEELGAEKMAKRPRGSDLWRRIVIEKPFGNDLDSALKLNREVHEVFDENQVYRIDHYLGKETSQNILFFRFANTIFEPVWNRRYVNSIQITVAEEVDVGLRAEYYDSAGVVRDMFQNHLLQLLTLVAMEPPTSFRAEAVRNEKGKLLESIRPIQISDTVRGQYKGYLGTQGVAINSQTPTYAAMKLYVDNWRWQGVPFYLRSGKALTRKASEIIVEFHRPPHLMFQLPEGSDFTPNFISLCIQPDEGIHLRFEVKVPDSEEEMRSVDMDFHYRSSFNAPLPEAYERLLLEAMQGDASLFTRSDSITASWSLLDPIIKNWESGNESPLIVYPKGSWGPEEADQLLEKDGRHWRTGCVDQRVTVAGKVKIED